MTEQQQSETRVTSVSVDVDRLAHVEKLDEVDFLKIRLLNKNIDMFDMQIELSKSRLKEAMALLTEFGNNVVQRYGLQTIEQIDPNTGVLTRKVGEPDVG